MSPRRIVEEAVKRGLNIIALTDHNAYENSFYAGKIAREYGLYPLYGIEVQTTEEVHVLGIFETYEDLEKFGCEVYEKLPEVPNNPDYFGDQVVVNEEDEILRFEQKLLLNSVSMSLEEVIWGIKERGGLAFLSHVNADHFSVTSQLGFIPENLPIDGVEVTYNVDSNAFKEIPGILNYPVITSSDSHYPEEIGRGYVIFYIEKPSLEEIKKALQKLEGRYYEAFGKHGRIV